MLIWHFTAGNQPASNPGTLGCLQSSHCLVAKSSFDDGFQFDLAWFGQYHIHNIHGVFGLLAFQILFVFTYGRNRNV